MPDTAIQTEDIEIIAGFHDEKTRETAFTQLVRKYQERLYWHIRRMVVEHEDANDVLQNVFIKVWKHLDNFRQEANLYTWLYRIATNETLTWLEKQKRRAAVSLSDVEAELGDRVTAQKGFDSNKIEWKLQQAIQTLPERQRLVFTLRYYDEMPYEQMAKVLETSEGGLKASYHHAVKKIEAFLTADT